MPLMIAQPTAALEDFIKNPQFPCVGVKSALGKGQLKTYVARSITSAWDDLEIHDLLLRFAWSYKQAHKLFTSFAVIFEEPVELDEAQFENYLWERVQSLTDKDIWRGQRADARVSDDPSDPHFSLSFGGEAFFVVGLHPRASRPARRFAHPTLIFNLHDQFEILRSQNRYQSLHDAILNRDLVLAGCPNPMLANHGSVSEARQYSGRRVPKAWTCPYHRSSPNTISAAHLSNLAEKS